MRWEMRITDETKKDFNKVERTKICELEWDTMYIVW